MIGRLRNQKWIWLCLAIAIMISGICLEKLPTGSYSSCNQTDSITETDNNIWDISACRIDTLSQRETLRSLRTAQRKLKRNPIRTFSSSGMNLSGAEILPQIFQWKQAMEIEGIYGNTSYSIAILSYIHNQDGEKA